MRMELPSWATKSRLEEWRSFALLQDDPALITWMMIGVQQTFVLRKNPDYDLLTRSSCLLPEPPPRKLPKKPPFMGPSWLPHGFDEPCFQLGQRSSSLTP
jgi:hypothetical protein